MGRKAPISLPEADKYRTCSPDGFGIHHDSPMLWGRIAGSDVSGQFRPGMVSGDAPSVPTDWGCRVRGHPEVRSGVRSMVGLAFLLKQAPNGCEIGVPPRPKTKLSQNLSNPQPSYKMLQDKSVFHTVTVHVPGQSFWTSLSRRTCPTLDGLSHPKWISTHCPAWSEAASRLAGSDLRAKRLEDSPIQ